MTENTLDRPDWADDDGPPPDSESVYYLRVHVGTSNADIIEARLEQVAAEIADTLVEYGDDFRKVDVWDNAGYSESF